MVARLAEGNVGRRVALLVATAEYVDQSLRRLRAPTEDARRLRELLLDPNVGGFDEVVIVANESKSGIERELERLFRDRSPEDMVLLYLSGHGVKNDYNQLFFATSNTDLTRPYSTAVPAVVVQHLVAECQARAKVVLLDCCFSGAFTAGQVQMSGNAVDLDEHLGRGVYVITATNELEYAYEREQLILDKPRRNSVFTAAVIKALDTGAADLDGDGEISVSELYKYVYDDLRAERVQTPTQSGKLEGNIRIAKARSGRIKVGEQDNATIVGDLLPSAESLGPTALPAPLGVTHLVDRHLGTEVHLDLAGHQRHLAVVGRIHSGKSTLIRTLVIGLTAIRGPQEVQFYCLDGDGRLNPLITLPHVRALHGVFEPERSRQLLTHIRAMVDQRRRLFQQWRIPDEDTFRHARNQGVLPPGEHADVFLVIDSWESLAEDLPGLAEDVKYIAGRGGSVGVQVILSARRWDEIPANLLSLLRGRIEFALDDPAESKIDPELAATLPDEPGWALHLGRRFHVALPQLTADVDDREVVLAGLRDGTLALADGKPLPWNEEPPAAGFLELLGFGSVADFDVSRAWRSRPENTRLRVPFGVDEAGQPVELDLKESAMGGMGPHGLCIGATGSGKSEFLRTLVLGLAATHSSEILNFALVDFKGGATFHKLSGLPHVSATITNLESDLSQVDRMRDALAGEVARRQALLAKAGMFKNVWDYERARHAGAELDPLPALLIVVDEFSELLTAQPDFIDLFVAIGRLGRSLQMHMLLASQRLEEGRLRGLDSHLSYRIGLRTFSAAESRTVLGVPDAFELPSVPGAGYLRFGTSTMTRFNATYVSGPAAGGDSSPNDGTTPTLLASIVEKLAGEGPPAHEVWLPPLDQPDSLDTLLPPLQPTKDRGLSPAGFVGNGRLQVPVGVVDRPYEQRRDLLWADFSGAAGHAAVVGGPQSGKSTMLRTLMMSLALTHTPLEVRFYCLDLGGGTLKSLAGLPHVSAVASRRDHDLTRRVIAEVTSLVNERERRFGELGVDSMIEFRNRRREFAHDTFADVFLVVDGWLTFRREFEEFEAPMADLAARGLSFGVHVILAAHRWAEIRPAVKDLVGTRFELRLGDPSESEIDRRTAVNVPPGRPGRGLSPDKLHFLVGLPRIDGSANAGDVSAGVREAVGRIGQSWHGPVAPPVRLLPDMLTYDDLLKQDKQSGTTKIPIGVNEHELAPVYLDFDAEPHFLAFAEGESGKTNLLRTIVRGLVTRYSEDRVVILLVDYRRSMLGLIETSHLLGYAATAGQLDEMMKDVSSSLRKRLPGPETTQDQLKHRSWWTGPELFVVVDDYDLVVTQNGNPLQPLLEFLPQAKDVGMHMIITRRSGGASRALFDPVIGRLKELASPALVMSADKDEGILFGTYRSKLLPPGRGTMITRKAGQQVIQVAWLDADPAGQEVSADDHRARQQAPPADAAEGPPEPQR